jgi:hypothetical protein
MWRPSTICQGPLQLMRASAGAEKATVIGARAIIQIELSLRMVCVSRFGAADRSSSFPEIARSFAGALFRR